MKASCHHFDGKDMAFLPFLQIFEKLISSYIIHLTSAIIHQPSFPSCQIQEQGKEQNPEQSDTTYNCYAQSNSPRLTPFILNRIGEPVHSPSIHMIRSKASQIEHHSQSDPSRRTPTSAPLLARHLVRNQRSIYSINIHKQNPRLLLYS